jgi:hypothetical protein
VSPEVQNRDVSYVLGNDMPVSEDVFGSVDAPDASEMQLGTNISPDTNVNYEGLDNDIGDEDLAVSDVTIEETIEEHPKLEVSDFVRLAEKGNFEAFCENIRFCSHEELSTIKDEIDIFAFTATVGTTRKNFEDALEIVGWQESHEGELYEFSNDVYQEEDIQEEGIPAVPDVADNFVGEFDNYDDDGWR